MNRKQFTQEFCDTKTIQKFLHNQGIIWDGTNYIDGPYGANGNFDHECVWLVPEDGDYPVFARFEISPLNFVIMQDTFLTDEQKIISKRYAEFGYEWRSFMAQEKDDYLPVAKRYFHALRRGILNHSFKTRDDLLKSLSSVQKAYQAKIIQAETNEECSKWNTLLAAKRSEFQTKIAKINIDTKSKIVTLQKVLDELDFLGEMKNTEHNHEK